MDPDVANQDVLHQPGFTFLMVGLVLLCLFSRGHEPPEFEGVAAPPADVRTIGIVEAIEVATDSNGDVLRRPRIRYTDTRGATVESTPVRFRTSSSLAVGSAVPVRYAPRRPERLVVGGFDIRAREIVYAALSLAAALAILIFYFATL